MRRTSTLPAAIPPTLALLILLLGALAIPSIYAANMRSTLPVIVAPENSTGGLTPNTLYHYNFVFANSTDCTPLLNISVNITTNSRGVGNATLNISSLGVTPAYICEYINGTLRKSHPVFSTMFDNKTAEVDITAYGFDKTSTLNTVFLRNASLPSCAGGQVLTSTGNGVFSCVADTFGSGGNTSWNETRANALYLLINDQRYNDTAIIGTIQNLTYALIAANIGNFSANNNSIWTAINAANNLTLTQITANIGNWSSAATNYYTTAQVNTLGNWSQDKPSYATLAQLNAGANLTYAQIATNIGNWSQDKPNYNTTSQLNTLYAPITTIGDNTSWNESRASALYATNSQLTSILNLSLAQITANIGNWSSAATNYYTTAQVNTLGNWSQDKPSYATLAQLNAGANLTAAYVAGAVGQNLTYALITTANGNWSQDKPSYNTTSQLNNLYAPISIVSDNSSWNQSLATTLYAPISTIGDNSSWNQSLASTLYAPITIIGDNTSWNETRANNLYLAINDQRYNESNTIATLQNLTYEQIAANIGNWSANNATVWTAIGNLQTANSTLNTSIANINNQITSLANISYTEIAANIGNWSIDKPNYATLAQLNAGANLTYAQIATNIGNWSQDKPNYNTTSQLNNLYAPISTIGDNTSWNESRANNLYATNTQLTSLHNLSLTQIATNIGNWSSAAANYYTTAQVNTIGNWSQDKTDYYTTGHIDTLGNASKLIGTCGPGTIIQNITANGIQCTTDLTGNGGNSSWNQSHADTLYAPIGSTGGNNSWNESYASTIYLIANDQRYNESNIIATLQNLTYAQISNNIGNWSADKTSYATLAQLNGGVGQNLTYALITTANGNWSQDKTNYNTTAQLNTIFASINTIGDNTSWNESRANALYAPLGSGNTSWNETRANAIYLAINDQRYNDTAIIGTIQNLTYTQIAANIGNWSSVAANYYTTSHIDTLGNASRLKGSFQCGGTDQIYNITVNDSGIYGLCSPQGIGGSGDNSSWNQSHANSLYLAIDDQRYNESNIIATLQNLTYAQISNNIGNWSSVAANYYTTTQINTIGNWTLDKPNYATLTQLNAGVGDNITKAYVTNAVGQNLTYNLITTANGNWSADKTSLPNLTLTQITNNIGNWTLDKPNYATTAQANTSWNESRANTLYAPIATIGDNTTWNQSLADSLYYPRNSGPTIIRQRTDVTHTSTSGWNSTDFQFLLDSGKNYTLRCDILFAGSSTANGQTINLSYDGTATNIVLAYDTWSSATAKVGFSATSFGTALVGTGSGATIIKPNFIFADFETTASGTLQLQIRSELAGNTTTLKRGSVCYLYANI